MSRKAHSPIFTLQDSDPSNTIATYTLGPGLIGQMVSVRRGGADAWYHYDGLGDVMRLTDASNPEQVVNSYSSDAWNNILSKVKAAPNQHQFIARCKQIASEGLDMKYGER